MSIQTTKKELIETIENIIKKIISEDFRTDSEVHFDAPDELETGIDPEDMRGHMLEQYSKAGEDLADFVRSLRQLKEMADEMSRMEADGLVEGAMGTEMWHALSDLYRDVKQLVLKWNAASEIN